MSNEQMTVTAEQSTTFDVEKVAAAIAAEIKAVEETPTYPNTVFAAVGWRQLCASLADRAEILYRVARAHATLKAIALPKDDPRGKNEESRKALVDIETWPFKTLATRAQVLSEASLHMVRHYVGSDTAPSGAFSREAA
jgi:hypothetical protein